jgi:hypothetical protein
MGNFLEHPITEKDTVAGEGNGIRYACSAMQGWRVEMEVISSLGVFLFLSIFFIIKNIQ